MNFFKTIFADEDEDPDSPKSESKPSGGQLPSEPDPDSQPPRQNQNPNPIDSAGGDASGWSFGGLIKTISTKSESVIEIYRRDLKEFGSGLKKEIEVAQGSIGNVGQTIEEVSKTVLKSTEQIISQGKDAILALDQESDSSDTNNERSIVSPLSLNSKPYSRFESQVRAIQGDASTFCEDPEDLDEFDKWKVGFNLEEKRGEIESLIEENSALESIYKRIVPNNVYEETFWCRYYYKVHKLKLAEDLRANLVKRAISREEEDLSWDVDEDEDENEDVVHEHQEEEKKPTLKENEDSAPKNPAVDEKETEKPEETSKIDEQNAGLKENIPVGERKPKELNVKKEENESKSDEKSGQEVKGENAESSKDSDVSVVSSHPSNAEEEDLGWDEIEDLSSIDERKVSHSGSPKTADVLRRLSGAAVEDEDLSWDIEDDDEPVKA